MTPARIKELREYANSNEDGWNKVEECLDEIERLREALRFYRDMDWGSMHGLSNCARKALGEE